MAITQDAETSGASPAHPPTDQDARRRRWPRVLAWSLATLLVLVAGAVGGYAWHLRRTVSTNVQHAKLLPEAPAGKRVVPQDEQGNLIDQQGRVVMDAQGKPVEAQSAHVNAAGIVVDQQERPILAAGGKPIQGEADDELTQPTRTPTMKNSLNYLVIGSDTRGEGRGRSDVMVLAHVSDDRRRVDLVHFPRDLYVTIPGRGKNKLNAAYAHGGAPLLVETLQPLVGVPIDHVAVTDFDGFQHMTDAIGGVDVPTESGTRHMSGTEALAWVRERKSLAQGDISRGQRQMTFIKAVLAQGLSKEVLLDPARFSAYLDAGTRNLSVDEDFSTGEMQKVAVSLRNLRAGDIHTATAPWTGVGTGPGGMSIVTMSRPQMKVLKEHLRTDTMASYSDPVSPTHGLSR